MVNKLTLPAKANDVQSKVNELVDDKQDTLVSGINIKTINNMSLLGSGNITISTGGTYTAGDGIDITNGVISVDSTVALKTDVPTITDTYSATSSDGMSGKAVASAISGKADSSALSDYVPTTRTVNSKALSSNINLTASDVGAQVTLVSGTNIKTINNESLLGSGNISISASPTFTYDSTNERLTIS